MSSQDIFFEANMANRKRSLNRRNMGTSTVRLFVGEEGREFVLDKKLLESTSPYFRQKLDVIFLPDRSSDMFELFVYWIHNRRNLEFFMDEAEADNSCEDLLWDLVNLHVFAAHIRLAALQDVAMDAIQDLHLRQNWDISPRLVDYVYTECDADESCRLRKWIVAMTAWTLGGGIEGLGLAERTEELFRECPRFWEDYMAHLSKSARSRIRLQYKNPQMRLPGNSLRGEERQFGFRQCSFHTHRSVVGQGRCPHQLLQQSATATSNRTPVSPALSSASSDDEDLWSVLRKEDFVSPRTAIFNLYSDRR